MISHDTPHIVQLYTYQLFVHFICMCGVCVWYILVNIYGYGLTKLFKIFSINLPNEAI